MDTINKNEIDNYKKVVDSIFLLIKSGIEQEPPKVSDEKTQSKIDFIYQRIKDSDKYCDNVYAYFFPEQNSVYVGRTLHVKQRDSQHRNEKSSSVYKFASLHNILIPQITVLEKSLTIEDGVKKEKYYTKKFEHDGWNLINIAQTGNMSNSIGTYNSEKWSFQKCYTAAKKFKSVKDFRANNQKAYNASVRNGFLEKFNWLDGRRYFTARIISYNDCKEIALKYDSLKVFMKQERKAYRFAKNRGWMNDFTWLKREKEHSKSVEQYTYDGVLLNTFDSINKASKITKIPYSQIYGCCNKKRNEAGGYLWRYK